MYFELDQCILLGLKLLRFASLIRSSQTNDYMQQQQQQQKYLWIQEYLPPQDPGANQVLPIALTLRLAPTIKLLKE